MLSWSSVESRAVFSPHQTTSATARCNPTPRLAPFEAPPTTTANPVHPLTPTTAVAARSLCAAAKIENLIENLKILHKVSLELY